MVVPLWDRRSPNQSQRLSFAGAIPFLAYLGADVTAVRGPPASTSPPQTSMSSHNPGRSPGSPMCWSLSPQGALLLPWHFPILYFHLRAPCLVHGWTALVPPGLLMGSC